MNSMQLKFNVIDKLISLTDADLLKEIDKMLAKIQIKNSEKFKLTNRQIEMMKASQEDIKYGRVISDEKLNEEEEKWLNE